MPLVTIIMKDKKEKSYEFAFRKILQEIKKLDPNYEGPERYLLDFEIGVRNAVKTIFPKAVIHGCLFHFDQALVRKLQVI